LWSKREASNGWHANAKDPDAVYLNTIPTPAYNAATLEEVAEWLSLSEGRIFTRDEVRQIEARAIRKLRAEFARRRLDVTDLAPR